MVSAQWMTPAWSMIVPSIALGQLFQFSRGRILILRVGRIHDRQVEAAHERAPANLGRAQDVPDALAAHLDRGADRGAYVTSEWSTATGCFPI